MRNSSELSLVYNTLGKLHFLCFAIKADESFVKEDTIESLSEIIEQLEELVVNIKLINFNGKEVPK
jgi:hypothetical protein